MPVFQKISSPEQLNDYIHVTASGAWFILISILIFFEGFSVWIFHGELEISFPYYVYTDEKENSFAYITIDKLDKIKNNKDASVRIADTDNFGKITEISLHALRYENIIDKIGEYNFAKMNLNEGNKFFKVSLSFDRIPDNIAQAVFVIKRVKPLSFLLRR